MMRFCLCLVALFFLSVVSEARIRILKELHPLIEEELSFAKLSLDSNRTSSKEDIEFLKSSLDDIWQSLRIFGFSETKGEEKKLRPAYVVMQGVLEKAQIRAYKSGLADAVDGFIITPRMPTPLTFDRGLSLSEVQISEASDFAKYRTGILKSFLYQGCSLSAVYCKDVALNASPNDKKIKNYRKYCHRFKNLKDLPIILIEPSNFPPKMSGALYYIDGHPIVIEARQVSLSDDKVIQIWAIRCEKFAEGRVVELNQFLKENTSSELILPKGVRTVEF